MLRGDALRPTEIGRGDTVDITRFDELELFNHQAEPVTVEYQVADIPISTKSQNIDINNSVTISEILTPITVSAVQAEVKTRIQNDTLTVKKLAELYTLQKVDTGYLDLTGDEQSIAGNEERKGLFIQTYQDNDRSVLVQGFIEVVAGGHVLIKSNEAITLEGVAGNGVRIGEFI
ncbi:hypothetical protein BCT47_16650 [Vibrio splendidus]|nr:hypothetical protein BCT47_16650 [Vibrio splendidus]CDT25214.1 conserved hypothetical protein [Vibrio crassostreae]CDT36923.1 conserved hypothetical protein [Vibrio crassostreae]CDT51200.1 conserved hypothetical protein [Vibrio crassostreae]